MVIQKKKKSLKSMIKSFTFKKTAESKVSRHIKIIQVRTEINIICEVIEKRKLPKPKLFF